MNYSKHWTTEGKEMIRTKPYIGSNDQLDSINEEYAEHQRTEHELGQCGGLDDHCPHCEADKQAELEARHYQRHVFDRLQSDFTQAFKRIREQR